MKLIFSIYTNNNGHAIESFDAFDKNGKNAFEQATAYAKETYNDPNDIPRLFLLSEIPMPANEKRTPAQWERDLGIEILDDDGWRSASEFGAKSILEPITEAEFRQRCNESTIREHDFKKI